MFLQNLWKKILDLFGEIRTKGSDLFSIESIKLLLTHNFQAVLTLSGMICILFFIITLSVALLSRGSGTVEEVEQNEVYYMKQQLAEYSLLLDEELELPALRQFSIKNDYTEYMPGREYRAPQIEASDFDDFFSDILQEECLFPVEKRNKAGDK